MPRIRTIKPDAFRSESLAEVSLSAERTFFGLLTEVDDSGRAKCNYAVLNGALWSLRTDHSARDMQNDLDELVEAGLVCRYQVDGRLLLHIPSFKDHQVINRPTKSRLAPCTEHEPDPGQGSKDSEADKGGRGQAGRSTRRRGRSEGSGDDEARENAGEAPESADGFSGDASVIPLVRVVGQSASSGFSGS